MVRTACSFVTVTMELSATHLMVHVNVWLDGVERNAIHRVQKDYMVHNVLKIARVLKGNSVIRQMANACVLQDIEERAVKRVSLSIKLDEDGTKYLRIHVLVLNGAAVSAYCCKK